MIAMVVRDLFDAVREHYAAAGYVQGSTMEAEIPLCAYCGDDVDTDFGTTCGRDLCEDEYWGETNAEGLR